MTKLAPHQIFGRNVCRLRNEAKITQEKLAEMADISRRFLQEIEAGTKNPTVDVITRIRIALKSTWQDLLGYPEQMTDENPHPHLPSDDFKDSVLGDATMPDDLKTNMVRWYENMVAGFPFFDTAYNTQVHHLKAENLFLSKCYDCGKLSIWLHDKILFPRYNSNILPNFDLPKDIQRDFVEASNIVDASPRGAAALLRLCVQKLCGFLGEKGKNIDEDIASLTAKGLDPLVRQALDIVRVIGNEAVHPGSLNLRDDKDTAMRLFELVNLICDQTISRQRKVKEMYSHLPPGKLEAIAKRDAGKKEKST